MNLVAALDSISSFGPHPSCCAQIRYKIPSGYSNYRHGRRDRLYLGFTQNGDAPGRNGGSLVHPWTIV